MPTYPDDWTSTMRPALYAWVSGVLGVGWTVAFGDQPNAPRPTPKPFASIRVAGPPEVQQRLSRRTLSVDAERADLRVGGEGLLQVEVQLYSDEAALPSLEALRLALEDPFGTEALEAAGLVFRDVLAASDLSAAFAGAREYRYLLEVRFALELRRVNTDVPWIESGPGGGLPVPTGTVS